MPPCFSAGCTHVRGVVFLRQLGNQLFKVVYQDRQPLSLEFGEVPNAWHSIRFRLIFRDEAGQLFHLVQRPCLVIAKNGMKGGFAAVYILCVCSGGWRGLWGWFGGMSSGFRFLRRFLFLYGMQVAFVPQIQCSAKPHSGIS